MAMMSRLEALSVSAPIFSIPRVKMVGNMMELNRPIATTLHKATWPLLAMVTSSKVTVDEANMPSSRRGSTCRIRAEPMKRPTMAPPQYNATYLAAADSLIPPMEGMDR